MSGLTSQSQSTWCGGAGATGRAQVSLQEPVNGLASPEPSTVELEGPSHFTPWEAVTQGPGCPAASKQWKSVRTPFYRWN